MHGMIELAVDIILVLAFMVMMIVMVAAVMVVRIVVGGVCGNGDIIYIGWNDFGGRHGIMCIVCKSGGYWWYW